MIQTDRHTLQKFNIDKPIISYLQTCKLCDKKQAKKVIPQIIGKKQKAYVENDNIGCMLLNLLASIKNCNEKKLPA